MVPLPEFVQIEPVGQCNLRCAMCPIQFRADGPPYGPPAFMPVETFRRLLDQFPGIRELHLQGLGEPMMHPRFFDMVEHAAGRGIRVGTNSNLTLLHVHGADRCVESGLAGLQVSIDGATRETYERIRRRARYDRVRRNLEALVAARARRGGRQPDLVLVAVAMRENLHELAALVRLAHDFGIPEVFVQHLAHDFGEAALPARYRPMREFVTAQTLLGADLADVEQRFEEARAAARDLGVRLRLPRVRPRLHPPGTPGRARCDWPWRGAYVSYDGQAMPCCMVATPDRANLGDMARDGVSAVWHGDAYDRFRHRLDSETPPDVCRSCSLYAGTF
jgi:radical SAM protein with 4Fe4S-binding SPASM domain